MSCKKFCTAFRGFLNFRILPLDFVNYNVIDLHRISSAKKPLVFFDSKLYDFQTSWVKTNNYEATYQATEECIRRGYNKFVIIGASPELLSTRIERSSGFIDALESNGFSCNSLVIEQAQNEKNVISAFVKERMEKGKKLLVFVPNCWALQTVFTALQDLKSQMPDQIGIIGFDNMEWTAFSSPRITTIVQPAYEEGKQACRILIDQIEEKYEEEEHQVLNCTVNWSESTL
ncbi:MAG: substrate-binding domain-containing protein [Bacillus sp. (in: firmicutes)]